MMCDILTWAFVSHIMPYNIMAWVTQGGPNLEEVIDYYDSYWFSVSGNTSPRFSQI